MAYPTSRKKYYLLTAINPKWTDAELIPDLYKHITSTSGQPLCDIFIPSSQRIGYFSVRSRETADKLVKSFANNYISCGRKSEANIIKISRNNYQIKVNNINNTMTSKGFESWILSLNYSSFDIQLLPSEILKPSNECILSFDTINAAIYAKQKLQDVPFREFPLYFTHWHVPRRPHSHSDSNSQCSGYSTANSTPVGHRTPSRSGPLYLRDTTVPPPPSRSPPATPLPPLPADSTVSSPNTSETRTLKINVQCTPITPMTPNAPFKQHYTEQKTPDVAVGPVGTLHNEIKKQQVLIDQLMQQNRSIQSELDEEKNFSKYMNDKYRELYKNYVALSRLNRILLWDTDNIIGWIMTLDNGWFVKYKPQLVYNMKLQNMNGAMLSKMNKVYLHRLGIVDINDQTLLLNHIHNLVNRN